MIKLTQILSNCAVQKAIMLIGAVACAMLGCIPIFAPQQLLLWGVATYLFGRIQTAPGDSRGGPG
jgi:hypothetical protein